MDKNETNSFDQAKTQSCKILVKVTHYLKQKMKNIDYQYDTGNSRGKLPIRK